MQKILEEKASMKLSEKLVWASFIATWIVWFFFDVTEVIQTPLSYICMNHWIPEAFVFFFAGYTHASKYTKEDIITILFLLAVLLVIVTRLGNPSLIGVFVSIFACSLFSSIFVAGIYLGKAGKLRMMKNGD